MGDATRKGAVFFLCLILAVASAKTLHRRAVEDGADAENLAGNKDKLLKDLKKDAPKDKSADPAAESAFNVPSPPAYDAELNPLPSDQDGLTQGIEAPLQEANMPLDPQLFGPEFIPLPPIPMEACEGYVCENEDEVCEPSMPEHCREDPQGCRGVPPSPRCIPVSHKDGKCPKPVPLFMPQVPCGVPPNPAGCRHDLNCPSVMKCCPTDECGKVCVPPQGIVKLGTCPSRILVAQGAARDQFPNNQLVACREDRDCVARQKCCKVNNPDSEVTDKDDDLDLADARAVCVNPLEIDQIEAQFHSMRMPLPPPGAMRMGPNGMPQPGMQGMPPMPQPGMQGMPPMPQPGMQGMPPMPQPGMQGIPPMPQPGMQGMPPMPQEFQPGTVVAEQQGEKLVEDVDPEEAHEL